MIDKTNEATAGDGFSPGAYWELVKQDGEMLFERLLEGFRAPTVPEGEVPTTVNMNYKTTFDRMAFTGITDVPKRTKRGNIVTSKGEFVYEKKYKSSHKSRSDGPKKKKLDFNSSPVH